MTAVPQITRPAPDRQRPLVVSSPHSGTLFPAEEQPLYTFPLDTLEAAVDRFVDELFVDAVDAGATLITSPINRFVIDLNRLRDDVSPRAAEGGRGKRGPGYYGRRGLIWSLGPDGSPLYGSPLAADVLERRLTRYYDPYHDALATELQALRRRFGYAILLDAHSMPSRPSASIDAPAEAVRADVVPGDLLGASCDRWLTRATTDFWREQGYMVAPNTPYRGGAIVRMYGRPKRKVHAIQLELNRALYMDEARDTRVDGFDDVRAQCAAFCARLAAVSPPR